MYRALARVGPIRVLYMLLSRPKVKNQETELQISFDSYSRMLSPVSTEAELVEAKTKREVKIGNTLIRVRRLIVGGSVQRPAGRLSAHPAAEDHVRCSVAFMSAGQRL